MDDRNAAEGQGDNSCLSLILQVETALALQSKSAIEGEFNCRQGFLRDFLARQKVAEVHKKGDLDYNFATRFLFTFFRIKKDVPVFSYTARL